MNGPCIDATLGNENGLCLDGTPVNANGPDVDRNRTDWTPPYIDFPYFQLFFLDHFDPFFSAYLSPPTLNLSPVYVAAIAPHLFRRIARAPKHR